MDFAHLWLIWKPVAQNLPWKNSSARWRHDDVIWPEWSFNARNAFTTGNWMNFRKILFASWSPSKKLGLPTSTTRSRSRLVAVHHSRYPKTQQSICFSNANRKTSRMVLKTNRLVHQPTGKSNFSAKKWYFLSKNAIFAHFFAKMAAISRMPFKSSIVYISIKLVLSIVKKR